MDLCISFCVLKVYPVITLKYMLTNLKKPKGFSHTLSPSPFISLLPLVITPVQSPSLCHVMQQVVPHQLHQHQATQ